MIEISSEDVPHKHVENFAKNEGKPMDLGVGIEELKTGDNPYFETPKNWKNDKGIACLLFGSTLYVCEDNYEAKNANSFLYAHCTEETIYDKGYMNDWYRIPESSLEQVY